MTEKQRNDRQAAQLISLFNGRFENSLRTQLCGGGDEPIYLPASDPQSFHKIIFTRDYFSSALHEVAHWCVAGAARRKLVDFGYWYAPDGRSAVQQQEFERVEVKPQAFEWIFSRACNIRFRVSADNLTAGASPSVEFKNAIAVQAQVWCEQGLPPRPLLFASALSEFYGAPSFLLPEYYCPEFLD